MLLEIFGAALEATHTAAKGLDEAVQLGGGLGVVGVATSGLASATGALSDSVGGMRGQAAPAIGTPISSDLPGLSLVQDFKSMISGIDLSWNKAPAVDTGAAITAPVIQTAMNNSTSFDCDFNDHIHHGITQNAVGGSGGMVVGA